MSASNGHAPKPNGRKCAGCRIPLTGRKVRWCGDDCKHGRRPPVPDPDAAPVDPMRWLPASDDDLKTERLKRQAVSAFIRSGDCTGADQALQVLLEMATADGQGGRPRYTPRTRRLAAQGYLDVLVRMVGGKDQGGAATGANPFAAVSLSELGAMLIERRTAQFGPGP